ncbi:MAG: outer membrane lipoprotein carrier protein LolA, partial [Alphaproteobacteria bacterium]|nr:outer membrane lipoprotein carrier protein LolA [Alphaproteobacteria bacterium]
NVHTIIEQMNYIDQESILSAHTQNNDKTVQRISAYLNSLKSIAAEFIQVAADGTNSDGMFFLSRPGKLRWQYNPPTPILIVINGKKLIYYDYELNEISYTNTHDVLGSFLTAERIDFSDKMVKSEVIAKNNIIRVTLIHKTKTDEKMVMIFKDNPLELKKMEFYDANGQMTSVSFHNAKYNHKIDDELFVVKNPRIFGKQKQPNAN